MEDQNIMNKKFVFFAILASITGVAEALPITTISAQISGPIHSSGPISAVVGAEPITVAADNPSFNYQYTVATATADSSGNYALSATASYRGEATASYTYSDTITNYGPLSNSYNLSFHVPRFTIDTHAYCGHVSSWWCGNDTYSESLYDYSVIVNGITLFSSSASVRVDRHGSHLDLSNDRFGMIGEAFESTASATLANAYDGVISLGELASGESLSFLLLTSNTTRRFADQVCSDMINDCGASANAGIGDPLDITAQPATFNISPATAPDNSVPEPATALLLLFPAGLLLHRKTSHTKKQDT